MSAHRTKHPRHKILVVDDEEDIRALFVAKLEGAGLPADSVDTIDGALALLNKYEYQAVLLDLFLKDENSLDAISTFLSTSPTTKIVILTAHGSIDFAVNAMNKGASGFLVKTDLPDTNIEKFKKLINSGYTSSDKNKNCLENIGIIGKSDPMKELAKKLYKLREVDSTVLLQGESGTGKELFARAIHNLSRRSSGPFIAINCAAISESILESELFGYKRGAFTDARNDRKGYFETCSDGTLFLDEIGEMSPSIQSKLLRVIQEKEVTPLGSCNPVPVNTRIIAATNRNLEAEVKDKKFRQDLFYRLAVFQLTLPTLRERKEDIPLLVNYFVEYYNNRFDKSVANPPEGVCKRLKAYDWPGNIRELQNAIERAVALSDNNEFSADDLLPYSEWNALNSVDEIPRISDLPLNYQLAKNSFEKHYISNLLLMTHGNVTEAARVSGQYRPNIYRLINKFQIDPHQYKDGLH
ncbi:MAG: sigma-54 dependent transcriptional regulator [Bdellovibrionota bacterium]